MTARPSAPWAPPRPRTSDSTSSPARPLPGNDIAASAFVDPTNGGSKLAGVSFGPQASFSNLGLATQTNIPVRYRVVGPAPSGTEVYNDPQTIASLTAGATTTVTFTSTSFSAGTYTIYAASELPGDQAPANDQITGTFEVLAPLCGTYQVGTGQPAPFNTLTGAIGRLNALGVSCAVVFELTSASYTTPAETFPIIINAIAGASATNTHHHPSGRRADPDDQRQPRQRRPDQAERRGLRDDRRQQQRRHRPQPDDHQHRHDRPLRRLARQPGQRVGRDGQRGEELQPQHQLRPPQLRLTGSRSPEPPSPRRAATTTTSPCRTTRSTARTSASTRTAARP